MYNDNSKNVMSQLFNDKNQNVQTIYVAGGCFWGVELYFQQVLGILDTEVGYANGNTEITDYTALSVTDHAETVKLIFDANVVSLQEILFHFFKIIDPTSLNKQGGDMGRQYRTGIYYLEDNQVKIINSVITVMQKKYTLPIQVEVMPLVHFIQAEEYHQDYLKKNPTGYCHLSPLLATTSLHDESLFSIPPTEELRASLTDLQYKVTQESGTEPPFSSEYHLQNKKGIYVDCVTKKPLFSSQDKFISSCGWPSFSKPITTDALEYKPDTSHCLERIEVVSKFGNTHLGHVFDDGVKELGGLRYCINGASLEFIPIEKMEECGYGEYLPYLE